LVWSACCFLQPCWGTPWPGRNAPQPQRGRHSAVPDLSWDAL